MLNRRRDKKKQPNQADYGLLELLLKAEKISLLIDKVQDVEIHKQLSFDLLEIEKEINNIIYTERILIES